MSSLAPIQSYSLKRAASFKQSSNISSSGGDLPAQDGRQSSSASTTTSSAFTVSYASKLNNAESCCSSSSSSITPSRLRPDVVQQGTLRKESVTTSSEISSPYSYKPGSPTTASPRTKQISPDFARKQERSRQLMAWTVASRFSNTDPVLGCSFSFAEPDLKWRHKALIEECYRYTLEMRKKQAHESTTLDDDAGLAGEKKRLVRFLSLVMEDVDVCFDLAMDVHHDKNCTPEKLNAAGLEFSFNFVGKQLNEMKLWYGLQNVNMPVQ